MLAHRAAGYYAMIPLRDGAVCTPRVSVVIPCYNHGSFIREAVASVSAQTFDDHEVIIVNDGSTDPETLSVLRALEADGIKVLNAANQGPAEARNRGIRHARGDYILPLDADDRIAPRFLELAVAELDRDDAVGVVYGRVCFIGEREGEWLQPEFCPNRILVENMIVVSAVFRRTDWQLVGGYRQNMRSGWEDWDFWLYFVELGRKIVKLPEIVFYYRILKDSRTRTLSWFRNIRLFVQLIRNHPSLYLTDSRRFAGILVQLLRSEFTRQFLQRS